MNETIRIGINLSIVGILIVFVILAVIAIIVSLIRLVDRDWKSREKKQLTKALSKPQSIDDLTLVLITAAVATMIKGRHRIRSVTRVKPATGGSAWSMQGRSVLLGSHVISKGNE